MPETTFKFKQFEIRQDKCAMKVGTDGVLIGAWANVKGAKSILDIGSGTGLIALMLAQRSPNAKITAIDIDQAAFLQAKENVENSKWHNRIFVYHASLQDFASNNPEKFDLIVSNPPYFSNAFKPENLARAKARHTDTLTFNDFFYSANLMLNDGGKISLIIPDDSKLEVLNQALNHFFIACKICKVYPNPEKPVKRLMLEFRKFEYHKEALITEELLIESGQRHQYSEKYIELTKDFYLKF